MSEKEALLISACLLGVECKYSGGHNAMAAEKIAALREKCRLIPVCPETAGGLPTPRDPSERRGGAVVSCKGRNVTAEYSKGADVAVSLAERNGCKMALLKEKSPSCGSGVIYDGTFTGRLIAGDGLAAERLKARGVRVRGESEVDEII